ncbi:MAG TPA: class I SAM-dependent methyltransferase [Epsilonproteobacteria bacterium]|nr:class I SAM-dependent methyltransferase [Campylobacterota bacterium]
MARINQKAFYQNNYETYGVSAEGVAWDSTQTQKRRFSTIVSCLGDIKHETLVDAGCGFGDFYLYLKEKNNLPKNYTGLDLCEPMVKEAKIRTGCKIVQRDILNQTLPLADWYVASGSMNLLTRMETRIFIQRCFEKSRKGFVFNLLCGKEQEGEFSYWAPHDILELCKPFGAKVQIKEGYMEGDFTIVLRA